MEIRLTVEEAAILIAEHYKDKGYKLLTTEDLKKIGNYDFPVFYNQDDYEFIVFSKFVVNE